MYPLFKSIFRSELSRGLTASVLIHTAALVGVGGMLISPPRPIGAASHTIEIEYSLEGVAGLENSTASSQPQPPTPPNKETVNQKKVLPPKDLKPLAITRARQIAAKKVVESTLKSPTAVTATQNIGVSAAVDSFENLIPAATVWSPKPPYPFAARQAKFEGKVLLADNIDHEGSPKGGKVLASSGRTDCDQVALNTVLNRWHFEPAKILGRPISWEQKIEVEYRLR
jgi:TonB family protein